MTRPRAVGASPRLSLLGEFRLCFGRDEVEVRRPAQKVLTYLALERSRPVRRSVLAERLWADADADHAGASLRATLCRLPRRDGARLVETTTTHVTLAGDVHVDLWHSEHDARAVTGAPEGPDVDSLVRSPQLWEAFERDLLPDWGEDWLLVEQESYRQLRLHALEALSVRLRTQGRFADALLAALAAVHGEPLRETAHLRVIEVHLAEGNAAEGLRQYQAYRRLIATELGLAPSAAIRRLVAPLLGRPIERRR